MSCFHGKKQQNEFVPRGTKIYFQNASTSSTGCHIEVSPLTACKNIIPLALQVRGGGGVDSSSTLSSHLRGLFSNSPPPPPLSPPSESGSPFSCEEEAGVSMTSIFCERRLLLSRGRFRALISHVQGPFSGPH